MHLEFDQSIPEMIISSKQLQKVPWIRELRKTWLLDDWLIATCFAPEQAVVPEWIVWHVRTIRSGPPRGKSSNARSSPICADNCTWHAANGILHTSWANVPPSKWGNVSRRPLSKKRKKEQHNERRGGLVDEYLCLELDFDRLFEVVRWAPALERLKSLSSKYSPGVYPAGIWPAATKRQFYFAILLQEVVYNCFWIQIRRLSDDVNMQVSYGAIYLITVFSVG